MSQAVVHRPEISEYAEYYAKYVHLVGDGDVIKTLQSQMEATLATLRALTSGQTFQRYADGKWSIREVVGHIIDAERIFAYRALRFARNDQTPLHGFEQDGYIAPGRFDERHWEDLLDELEVVRRGTLLLFGGFDEAAWQRRGMANGAEITVRALAYVIAGHELHHMKIVRERYLA
ncbi:MAG: DinB family protein [Bryobacterales bacterium]|nr:DinB family protein [Bryobacterales bacterium]